jgi:hypothetical protein
VCFGPVVTAVSPLAEMRGTFSWARTSFHEFTHVIHLGLSHNRCPRWITEGIATWEEVHKNPSWSRNMRRELVDALANEQIIPVRELNGAFRTEQERTSKTKGVRDGIELAERHVTKRSEIAPDVDSSFGESPRNVFRVCQLVSRTESLDQPFLNPSMNMGGQTSYSLVVRVAPDAKKARYGSTGAFKQTMNSIRLDSMNGQFPNELTLSATVAIAKKRPPSSGHMRQKGNIRAPDRTGSNAD